MEKDEKIIEAIARQLAKIAYPDTPWEADNKRLELLPGYKERARKDARKLLSTLKDMGFMEVKEIESGVVSREVIDNEIPDKDCSGHTYSESDREDLIRYMLLAAEIQLDHITRGKPIYREKRMTQKQIDMCLWYNPLVKTKCNQGHRGCLKCHERRMDCSDYRPSKYWGKKRKEEATNE